MQPFLLLAGHTLGHFIMCSPLEERPKGHFTTRQGAYRALHLIFSIGRKPIKALHHTFSTGRAS